MTGPSVPIDVIGALAFCEATEHVIVVARPETRKEFDAVVAAAGPDGYEKGYQGQYLMKRLGEKGVLHLHPPAGERTPALPPPDNLFVTRWLEGRSGA